MSSIKPEEYKSIYAGFEAAISRYDCGQYCAPHNGGEPVCCSTKNAIPVATIEEWKFLKSRTDLWHIYQPHTEAERITHESHSRVVPWDDTHPETSPGPPLHR